MGSRVPTGFTAHREHQPQGCLRVSPSGAHRSHLAPDTRCKYDPSIQIPSLHTTEKAHAANAVKAPRHSSFLILELFGFIMFVSIDVHKHSIDYKVVLTRGDLLSFALCENEEALRLQISRYASGKLFFAIRKLHRSRFKAAPHFSVASKVVVRIPGIVRFEAANIPSKDLHRSVFMTSGAQLSMVWPIKCLTL